MARYDYKCEPCETTFEVVRPLSDRSAVGCPECGAPAKRVFSPVGVHFKGSGFHNTDYRKKDTGPTEAKTTPACGEGCATCPAKTETSKSGSDTTSD